MAPPRRAGLAVSAALAASAAAAAVTVPPRVIVTIIVDDLGWNNVGWHMSKVDPTGALGGVGPESATPHLNGLAADGVVLNRHYSHFTCTPSRSSFMTGRLPMHVQQTLANPDKPTAGIPRNMTALPLKLREANFTSHIAGKWDLGFSTPEHTPEGRGYNSSLVYAEHMNFYWTQRICPTGTSCNMSEYAWLTDLWDSGAGSRRNGTDYIEALFAERLLAVVAAHDLDADGPLHLDYRPHVAHWPLQVPEEWYARFPGVRDDEAACGDDIPHVWPGANRSVLACRRQYIAMVALMDEVVGNLTGALRARGWWDETLLLLTSDNGGSIATRESAGSNYPMRGGKYDPLEGGVRVAAFVAGGYLPAAVRGSVLEAPVHIADWYATLCGLVGVDPTDARAAAAQPPLPPIDSLDVWPLLSGANATSPRDAWPIAANVAVRFEYAAAAGGGGAGGSGAPTHGWKLVTGVVPQNAGWQGPVYPNASSPASDPSAVALNCSASPCLFDVVADPTEHVDLAALRPDVVARLQADLAAYAPAFFSNSDSGVDVCPPGTGGDCACWAAAHVWGGYLGPWQR